MVIVCLTDNIRNTEHN